MDTKHGTSIFTTTLSRDDEEGSVGLELQRRTNGETETVARIVFWDAEGQFALEMLVPELPLAVVEDLIREAKASIPTG